MSEHKGDTTSSYFTDESYLSSLSSEDSKLKWLKFSPSLWTCSWEQGALFALHAISDSLVPYFTVFFCSALLFSGPTSLQVHQTSPWVLASSIISSLAFIFTPILKQGPLSYVTPWSPVDMCQKKGLSVCFQCSHTILYSKVCLLMKSTHLLQKTLPTI